MVRIEYYHFRLSTYIFCFEKIVFKCTNFLLFIQNSWEIVVKDPGCCVVFVELSLVASIAGAEVTFGVI